jgi:integrase
MEGEAMANWFRRPAGAVVVQFVGIDKRKRTLSLGNVGDRVAERAYRVVESLVDAARYSQPAPPDAVAWLDGLPDETYSRFVAVGLVNAREKRDAARVTVAAHAEAYLARRTDVKHSTRLVLGHVIRNLADYFQTTPLADVMAGDCDDFARWLASGGRSADQSKRKGAGLSPATCGKRLQWCSSIFRDGVRRGLIPSNPFDDVKKPGATNTDRQQYVPAEVIETLIEAEPDPEWRALLAMSRYLGVRVPSEPFSMVWSDVDWERKRIRIPSPKTECHGKAFRVAPLLPEVMRHLEALDAVAPEGSLHVFSRLRERESAKAAETGLWANLNLRTGLLRKLAKAGIAPWPKLWHALRASAETDLAARFPIHVVAGWLGNTPKIAAKHYLMTTDDDFDRAATETALPKALLALPETVGIDRKPTPGNAKTPRKSGFLLHRIAERGREQPAFSAGNQGVPLECAAESAAAMDGNYLRPAETVAGGVVVDPLLDRLAAAWPGLGDADRLAVVGLAERLAVLVPNKTNASG